MRGITAPTSEVSFISAFLPLSILYQATFLFCFAAKTFAAFLSYLRLSIYMAIVSVAITVSFHIKGTPSDLERRVAKPLGGIFWVLSVVTLALGAGNYIREFRPSLSAIYLPLSSLVSSMYRWELTAVVILLLGTVNLYGKRAAIVQSGWKTQVVSLDISVQAKVHCIDSAVAGVGYNSYFNHWNVHHIVSRR